MGKRIKRCCLKFVLFLLFAMQAAPAFAVRAGYPIQITPLNFGVITINPNTAVTATLDYNGNISVEGGVSNGGQTRGEVETTTSTAALLGENITHTFRGAAFGPAACAITISGYQVNPSGSVNYSLNAVKRTFWGATITIPENCPPGDYQGTVICRADNGTAISPDQETNQQIMVTIRETIAIENIADLDFGKIIPPAAGQGSVTIGANGQRSSSGGAALVGGAPSAGRFSIYGRRDANVNVTMPGAFDITRAGGATLRVQNIVPGTGVQVLGNDGYYHLNIGATLIVPAAAESGIYSGIYSITANY
ncbi:MAG: DUF4402 domain-containing protein [Elusimicrobiota bacterium]|jgi:hypothetical protein|nr:DUF4402 domain-containing protein [Elusimicrobiota bacterium]